MPTKNEIKGVKYNYTVDPIVEEESKLLKEAISELKKELERYKEPPLMVADVKEIVEDQAIIKIQICKKELELASIKIGSNIIGKNLERPKSQIFN